MWIRICEAFKTSEVQRIADAVGLSYQSVYKWQKGMLPSHETLVSISTLTNSSIDWLLTGKGEKFLDQSATADESANTTDEEFAGLFFDYKNLTEEDKEELRVRSLFETTS